MNICIIASNFYPDITKELIKGVVKELKKNKVSKYRIITVAGTFEIPVVISNFLNQYDGFIALGCVIKGETPHFHYISSTVIKSLVDLSVRSKKPIGNGILTCNKKKQAFKRSNRKKLNKGGEAVRAILSVLKVIK